MKHKIKFQPQVIIFSEVIVLFSSCARNEIISLSDEFKGNLKLNVGLEVTVYNNLPNTRAAACDNFRVQIFKSNVTEPVLNFEHASELPDLIALTEGEYYVTASSGANPAPAFESPFYYGESEPFIVIGGETSTVNVICKLTNVGVTVKYSEQVSHYFSDYNTTVRNTTDSLVFTKNETRVGFFNPGSLHIKSHLSYMAGGALKTKVLSGDISNTIGGKHYEINVDTTPDEGDHTISISVDQTVDTILVNLTDEGVTIPADPGNGNLLITEIMYNPNALGDTYGEWIEIFNNTSESINLKDLVIRKGGTTTFHQITSDVVVASGDYAVVAKTDAATSNVDYVWSGMSLTNTGDELIISTYGTNGTDGTIICCIDFKAAGFNMSLDGKSLQLDPTVRDIYAVRLGSNWCAATQPYSTGDLGTPGLPNSACE